MDASIKIPCTLIPVSKNNLLLPNSAIAEVLICGELVAPAGSPSWLCGVLNWQNHDVRVIDFDKMDSSEQAVQSNKNTVIIARNPTALSDVTSSSENKTPFFGVLVKNIPQVVEVNSRNIDRNLHPQYTHSHAKSYISINNIEAVIPNIESLVNTIENINLS